MHTNLILISVWISKLVWDKRFFPLLAYELVWVGFYFTFIFPIFKISFIYMFRNIYHFSEFCHFRNNSENSVANLLSAWKYLVIIQNCFFSGLLNYTKNSKHSNSKSNFSQATEWRPVIWAADSEKHLMSHSDKATLITFFSSKY